MPESFINNHNCFAWIFEIHMSTGAVYEYYVCMLLIVVYYLYNIHYTVHAMIKLHTLNYIKIPS